MVNKNLIGRCGLYCGVCEIYRAYKDSQELRGKIAKKHNCLPEEVRCEGCQALSVYGWSYEKEWGSNCKILKCLNAKGFSFCYECPQYDTCQLHAGLAKACLPRIDLRANLQLIREGKAEEWLLEQDQRWRCPKCGNPVIVSYEFKECHWCGNKLRE
jgi:hypothetical protein